MGRRQLPSDRAARRDRNRARRLAAVARQADARPQSPRRILEQQRALAKMQAADEAWRLVLAAVAPLAPGGGAFKYASLAFADPSDARAYKAELDAALATAGEEGQTPVGRWRAWAAVAVPWIERRKLRPVPVRDGQIPRARVYQAGPIRLVAPNDPDMVALLARLPAPPGPAPAAAVLPAPDGGG